MDQEAKKDLLTVPLVIKEEENNSNTSSSDEDHDETIEKTRSESILRRYNPFASPPDIEKARKHSIATRVSVIRERAKELDFCEDCGFSTKNQLIPICSSNKELGELGMSYLMYFGYIIFCALMLVLLLLVVGMYDMYAYTNGTRCTGQKLLLPRCASGFIMDLSLGNSGPNDSLFIASVLNLVFVLLGLPMAYYYNNVQKRAVDEAESGFSHPSSYTAMIRGIPSTANEESIKRFFTENGTYYKKPEIKKVMIVHSVEEYLKLITKKNDLLAKINKDKSLNLSNEMNKITHQIERIQNRKPQRKGKAYLGPVFVTFNTERELIEVLDRYELSWTQSFVYTLNHKLHKYLWKWSDKSYNNIAIKVERAPDPLDINWENLGVGYWNQFVRRSLTMLITLIFIIGAVHLTGVIASNILLSLRVFIIKFILDRLIIKLSRFDRNKTYTSYQINIAKRMTYFQLFNFVFAITESEKHLGDLKLWTRRSIVFDVFWIFVMNACFPTLKNLFHPKHLLKLYKRWKLVKDPVNSTLTQREANQLFEGMDINIGQRYSQIQITLLLTAYYASLLPFGIVISTLGLIFNYWGDKYLFLRRYVRLRAMGKKLAREMLEFFNLFFLLFTLGVNIFGLIRRGRNERFISNFIAFLISFVAYIIPYHVLAKPFERNNQGSQNKIPYDEAKFNFITDYDRVNPVTQEKAIDEWINIINEHDHDKANEHTQRPVDHHHHHEHVHEQMADEKNDQTNEMAREICIEMEKEHLKQNPVLSYSRTHLYESPQMSMVKKRQPRGSCKF